MQDLKLRPIYTYLILFGVVLSGIILTLVGIAGFIYSTYPLGTQKASTMAGGPGVQIQMEIPNGMRASDTGIVRFSYEFAAAPEVDSTGQLVIPEVDTSITITLHAPSFDTAPSSGEPITKRIKNQVPEEWKWVIKPEQEGEQHIVLDFTGIPGPLLAQIAQKFNIDKLPANSTIMDTLNWPSEKILQQSNDPEYIMSLVVPISVLSVLGFTAPQVRVASIISTFLGPGVTVTGILAFLYKLFQKNRSEDKKKQQSGKRTRK